jgi:hypothetical protein
LSHTVICTVSFLKTDYRFPRNKESQNGPLIGVPARP